MTSKRCCILIFLAIGVYSLLAQSKEGCYSVPSIQNYDFQKISGTWNIQEVSNDVEASKQCSTYVACLEKTEKGIVIHTFAWFFSPTVKGEKNLTTFDMFPVNNTSEFKIKWYNTPRTMWSITKDLQTYSIWYICIPEEKDKGIFFISTRDQHAKESTLQKAHGYLRAIGLDPKKLFLRPVDRTGC